MRTLSFSTLTLYLPVVAFTGCDLGTDPVAEVEVTAPSSSLVVGQTVQLSATLKDASGKSLSSRAITWSSSEPMVAEVSAAGVVIATGPGTATVTATAEDKSGSVALTVSVTPVVSAGWFHTCRVGDTGTAHCWGQGRYGQLGNGPTISSSTPVLVSGGLKFISISGGERFTCGLTPGNAAYCWGDNSYGQLGNRSTTASNTPVPVSGGFAFKMISTGYSHACGITSQGATLCWGLNTRAQLGSTSTAETCPSLGTDPPLSCSTRPVPVPGGVAFAAISAGAHHSCGFTSTGAAYCWGANFAGQLGTEAAMEGCGPFQEPCSTRPVAVAGGLTFASVTAGGHTCGIARSGAAYCWGRNASGQIGDARPGIDPTQRSQPVAVAGGMTFALMSAGLDHTCAVTTSGAAYCWGFGHGGQLGNGRKASSSSPSPVSGGLTFTSVSSGRYHTCGLATNGATYCWGVNQEGQLGGTSAADGCAPDRSGSRPCTTIPLPVTDSR